MEMLCSVLDVGSDLFVAGRDATCGGFFGRVLLPEIFRWTGEDARRSIAIGVIYGSAEAG
jgi:hypothetical protein